MPNLPPLYIGSAPTYTVRRDESGEVWNLFEVFGNDERFITSIPEEGDARAIATALNGRRQDVVRFTLVGRTGNV